MNATTSSIVPFSNPEFGDLRVIDGDDGLLFCAKDVASALGYRDTTNAIKQHCNGVVKRHPIQDSMGRTQEAVFITEPDVFRLIVSSKLPAARKFESWVFDEVLPSIRRTGGYLAASPEEAPEQVMARALLLADETIRRQRSQLDAARPKADLCDAMLLPSKGAWTVSEAARYLANIMPKVRRQDVFDALRDGGMMCRRGTAPTRAGIDTGRMVALAGEYRDPETGEMTAGRQRGKLTAKGIGWLTVALGGGSV